MRTNARRRRRRSYRRGRIPEFAWRVLGHRNDVAGPVALRGLL